MELSPEQGVPHWWQVEVFDIHPFPSRAGFSAEGYAGGAANSLVFGGSVILKGDCPLRNAAVPGHPLEYRFLIGEWSWQGGTGDPGAIPDVAPVEMTPVTQLATTHVGYVAYTNALGAPDLERVLVGPNDMLPGAWIRIDGMAVTVDMRNGSSDVVHVSGANFLHTSDLFVLNSPAITGLHPARLPGRLAAADAGRKLSTAESEPIRRYRLVFEARDGASMEVVATDTLDSIVLDNSPVALALDLEELRVSTCNPVSADAVHILYTIDHPHLRLFRLGISSNSGGVHPPPALPRASFLAPPPVSRYQFRGAAGGVAVDVSDDPACAYRVELTWQTRHYLSLAHSADRLYCMYPRGHVPYPPYV
jgi:hypothetical protein